MFSFFGKEQCSDMSLFGYLTQACGGARNQAIDDKSPIQERVINSLVQLHINRKKVTINQRQAILIAFAAELVAQDSLLKRDSGLIKCVNKFGEMLEGNWDFRDLSILKFKEELSRYGCVFDF